MSLACLACTKSTVDIVGQLMEAFDDSKEDRDLEVLFLVREHFNNPKVKQNDWERLQDAYGKAVDRIAARLKERGELQKVHSAAQIISGAAESCQ